MANDNYRKKEKKDWGSRPVYPETAGPEEKTAPTPIETEEAKEPLIQQEEISDRVTISTPQPSTNHALTPTFKERLAPEEDCSWKDVYKKQRVPLPRA